jgi:transcriptional regulator with XRE-family HTH domain
MLAIVSSRVQDEGMASLNVGSLGEYIREQRRNAQYSLRQLAEAAGVSNPYLSQIERGLRRPSAEILQQIAKALRISAETLYVQAGILEERQEEGLELRASILAEPLINERQKQVLLAIYDSFLKENGATWIGVEAETTEKSGVRSVIAAADSLGRAAQETTRAAAKAVGARAAQVRGHGRSVSRNGGTPDGPPEDAEAAKEMLDGQDPEGRATGG